MTVACFLTIFFWMCSKIYVPIKTTTEHWYLMIINLEDSKIYQLDSNCPIVASEFRKTRIKRLVIIDYLHANPFNT